jgi:hypothetical protein
MVVLNIEPVVYVIFLLITIANDSNTGKQGLFVHCFEEIFFTFFNTIRTADPF